MVCVESNTQISHKRVTSFGEPSLHSNGIAGTDMLAAQLTVYSYANYHPQQSRWARIEGTIDSVLTESHSVSQNVLTPPSNSSMPQTNPKRREKNRVVPALFAFCFGARHAGAGAARNSWMNSHMSMWLSLATAQQ